MLPDDAVRFICGAGGPVEAIAAAASLTGLVEVGSANGRINQGTHTAQVRCKREKRQYSPDSGGYSGIIYSIRGLSTMLIGRFAVSALQQHQSS